MIGGSGATFAGKRVARRQRQQQFLEE